MLTFFKVFIITKGTLYYRNTIGRGLFGVGTQHSSLQTVRPRRYSQNLNCSVLCPLPPTFGLSRVYDSITLTDKTPKTCSISTKMCRSIHHTGLPIILYRLKISATGSLALHSHSLESFSIRTDTTKKRLVYTTAK